MRSIKGTLVFWMVLVWLGSAGWAVAEGVTLTDQAKRTVTVPVNPDRIVALGPGALRLVVYLQAQDKVAGVEEMEKKSPSGRPYWLAQPQLAQLPSCGPGGPAAINKKPDMEAVMKARPQVIFVTYMDTALADEIQRTLQVPVVVLSYGTFATFDEAVFDALKLMGKVLGKEERAAAVVDFIEAQRKDLDRRASGVTEAERPKVYVGAIGFRGLQGIESSEQRYAPFQWTKAINLADELKSDAGSHVFTDKETLLRLDPSIIFIDGGGSAVVEADWAKKPEFYQALQAVRNERVYALLPFNWYTTNLGTTVADTYAVGKILYPSQFADIDVERKTDEIYTFLVGRPVYAQMKKDYGAIGSRVSFLPGRSATGNSK